MLLTIFYLMMNIGNYREFVLKLFIWSLSLENVIFFENLMKRKLSLLGQLHSVSGIASAGRRWVSKILSRCGRCAVHTRPQKFTFSTFKLHCMHGSNITLTTFMVNSSDMSTKGTGPTPRP